MPSPHTNYNTILVICPTLKIQSFILYFREEYTMNNKQTRDTKKCNCDSRNDPKPFKHHKKNKF